MKSQSDLADQGKNDETALLEYSTQEGQLGIVGFWIFIAAEVALFATLFATYLVLLNRTAGGPSPHDIYEIAPVLAETFILLTSSFTYGLVVHSMRAGNVKAMVVLMLVTLLLGLGFIGLEVKDFLDYASEGATLSTSAFMSGFSLLVGTHGAHVSVGIIWMLLVVIQLVRLGLNATTAKKVFIVGLYWHFLDVVWIFIFTTVYLTGLVIGK